MSGYPIHIITNYRAGKISRRQFIRQFSDWQKSRGIDYGCKGLARHGFVGITYRVVNATIRGKVDMAICDRLRGALWN